jgi:hypothetical protein
MPAPTDYVERVPIWRWRDPLILHSQRNGNHLLLPRISPNLLPVFYIIMASRVYTCEVHVQSHAASDIPWIVPVSKDKGKAMPVLN